jgi:hypothetical protein
LVGRGGGVDWTGQIWLRIETHGGLLWMRWWSFGFYIMQGTVWLAEKLLASEGACSTYLDNQHHTIISCRSYGLQSKIPSDLIFDTRWRRMEYFWPRPFDLREHTTKIVGSGLGTKDGLSRNRTLSRIAIIFTISSKPRTSKSVVRCPLEQSLYFYTDI